MDLNHSSSCWESILEKVKPHIPTIDFDSSSDDNEEIVTIYERPAGLSLKISEDFDLFSVDDGELELLKPDAQICWSEDTVKLDDEDILKGTTATQWETQHSDADVEANVSKTGVVNGEKPHTANIKLEEGFPILSFAGLDQWDLDDVLQNLKQDGLSLKEYVSVEPAKAFSTRFTDGDKDRFQGAVMERRVAFSKSQSVAKPVESPNHIIQTSVCNKSSERMEAELQLSHRERPTVYIDLHCPDPLIKPPRSSLNPSPESKLPAKQNTHQETLPKKQKNDLKVHAGSHIGDRKVTGKSMLLQKIREMNRNGNKCTDPQNSVNEAGELKEKIPQPVESKCSIDSHHLWGDKQCSHVENSTTATKSAIKRPKQTSDYQRQQVKTLRHEQHQQILKQLEKHRPTKSVNQEQPAAERTDVLYDFEASHLQPISTLPADIESKGHMLLIVNLSSPGVVGTRDYGRRKQMCPAATRSDIYNTLVAWFLSLVGPEPHQDKDDVDAAVPFWVAGLQQLWTEDGLALHVLAVARQNYTPRKRDKDIHTPFYNHVRRFLSQTPLALIAHWLPQLKNLLDEQAFISPVHLPSSCLSCFISTTSNKKVIDRTFGFSPGFYWQTVETQEHVCKGRETTQELHTEVSVVLGCKAFLTHPVVTHYTLQLVFNSGLDVCGLRLLYPPQKFLTDSADAEPVIPRTDEPCQPVLALAVRGHRAHSVLKDLTCSLDTLVLIETDLSTLHCRGQDSPLCYSPQLDSQVHRELCLWFSGLTPSEDRTGGLFQSSRSPSFLCATTKADLLLVVSPAVPPCLYGQVLTVCERRGFGLLGLQRLTLQRHRAAVLGLSNQQALVFCSPHTVTLDQGQLEWPSHCLVLFLRKENALHHSVSLPAALMRELKAQKLLGCIHSRLDGAVQPSLCFQTAPYSSNLFNNFIRCMWAVPDPSTVILSHWKRPSNPNLKQVVILTLCRKDESQGLSLLHRVLTEEPGGFELLGLKWLPELTRFQAQELSPYEVGEQLYPSSLYSLMSSPALVCALRRVDAIASLRKFLPHNYPGNLSVLMSPTPEVAFRQASLFFFEHEMIPDHSIHPVLKFPPQKCSTKDPQMQLTVCLFKPTVWNHTQAQIIHKLQQSGLTLVGLCVLTLDRSDATSLLSAEHDPTDLEAHVEYLCSGSSLAVCLKGENAVRRLLDVLGREDSSSLWTYQSMAHPYKGIYGSGSYSKAIQDMKMLFPEGLCCTETSTMRQELILRIRSDPVASVQHEQSCTPAPGAQKSLSPSMVSGPNAGIHGAPWQTTCLLIPVDAPPLSQVLDMLEWLLSSGCHLVAGRMSILDSEQRKHIAEMLRVSSRGDKKMAPLYSTPCLILALQGEDVATDFNLILKSIYKGRPDLENVGEMITYPESQKQAKQLIRYLFDALSPESCQTILT